MNTLTPSDSAVRQDICALMYDFTLETTPSSAAQIQDFSETLRPDSNVYVTFLPGSDYRDTVTVSKRLRKEGMRPIPHIAARSIPNKKFLAERDYYYNNWVHNGPTPYIKLQNLTNHLGGAQIYAKVVSFK